MPFYVQQGQIPRKRHIQFRAADGALRFEELVSRQGFSDVYSNLYHLRMPTRLCRMGELRTEAPEAVITSNRARHLKTAELMFHGDALTGRRTLFFNQDLRIEKAHFSLSMTDHYRNGHFDELLYIQEGQGELRTNFGRLVYGPGDYLVIPRGVIYQLTVDSPVRMLAVLSRGPIEPPDRYRNRHGQLLEHSPYCERDIRIPEFLPPVDQEGEFPVQVRLAHGVQQYVYGQHPFDVVGWDGYYYPWAFNINDFEPVTGRLHQPPPVHQTFQAPGFVVCSFVSRLYDYHPEAIPAPYPHSNVDSEELIFYSMGNFMSRKGIEAESITLHPMGLPHGPHPGKYEESIGKKGTEELAVMIDTFSPLQLTRWAVDLDEPSYPLSWWDGRK